MHPASAGWRDAAAGWAERLADDLRFLDTKNTDEWLNLKLKPYFGKKRRYLPKLRQFR
jgi:hypothetical protein